ncbi:MAG: hypothetical protein ACPK85_00500 [Methanosarcina sp.]
MSLKQIVVIASDNIKSANIKGDNIKSTNIFNTNIQNDSIKNNCVKNRVLDSLSSEDSAYSTIIDALFLLIFISVAGVLLMPSLQTENQYTAAGYVSSSELNSYMLESLLSCKLENFEYESSPLSVINVSIPENSVVKDPSRALFGKEQKHRTFSDLITEYLALSLQFSGENSNFNSNSNPDLNYNFNSNSTSTSNSDSNLNFSTNKNTKYDSHSFALNPLTKGYSSRYSEAISAYLDRKVAGRFSYRFEAYWYPVEAFPLGSELIIGEEPPANAFRQSAKLSMPLYVNTPSKDTLFACVNDSVLQTSLNSSDKKAKKILNQGFSNYLDSAAQAGADEIIGLLFSSDYSGSIFEKETSETFDTLIYGVSENQDKSSTFSSETEFVIYFSDLLESRFPINHDQSSKKQSSGSQNNQKNKSSVLIGSEAVGTEVSTAADLTPLKEELHSYIKKEIKKELEAEFSDNIYETISSIVRTENLSEARALRNERVESIYREINPGGARIVLSIWDSN